MLFWGFGVLTKEERTSKFRMPEGKKQLPGLVLEVSITVNSCFQMAWPWVYVCTHPCVRRAMVCQGDGCIDSCIAQQSISQLFKTTIIKIRYRNVKLNKWGYLYMLVIYILGAWHLLWLEYVHLHCGNQEMLQNTPFCLFSCLFVLDNVVVKRVCMHCVWASMHTFPALYCNFTLSLKCISTLEV